MKKRIRPVAIAIVVVLAASPLMREPIAYGQTPVQMEDILKVWDARQNKLKSLQAQWTEEMTTVKGSISKQVPPQLSKGEVLPPEDFNFQNPVYLKISESKIFHQYLHHQWDSSKKAYFDSEIVQAFDGDTDRHLTGKGATGYPYGVITKGSVPDFISDIKLRPYLMHFRATYPKLAPFRGMPFRLTGKQSVIQDRVCLEIQVLGGPDVNLLWVDPGKEYSILRMMTLVKNTVVMKADVTYGQDDRNGIVPVSWNIVSYLRDGTMFESIQVKKTSHEFNNTIPSESFQVTWPVGTVVHDLKSNTNFIQKEGNNTRTILDKEVGTPYEVLVSTPGRSRFSNLLTWPIALGVGFFIVSGCVLIAILLRYRKLRKHKLTMGQ